MHIPGSREKGWVGLLLLSLTSHLEIKSGQTETRFVNMICGSVHPGAAVGGEELFDKQTCGKTTARTENRKSQQATAFERQEENRCFIHMCVWREERERERERDGEDEGNPSRISSSLQFTFHTVIKSSIITI